MTGEQNTKVTNGVTVRLATLADRPAFCFVWQQLLHDQFAAGSTVEPSDHNLLEYTRLFQAYVAGSMFGFFVLAEDSAGSPVGGALLGEETGGTLNLGHTLGRMATLWGVHVVDAYRQQGVARRIQHLCIEAASALGFDSLVSTVLLDYPAGEFNAYNYRYSASQDAPTDYNRAVKKQATVILVPLRD